MNRSLPTTLAVGTRFATLLAVSFSIAFTTQSCKKDKLKLSNLTGISSFSIKGFETFAFTIDQNALTIANVDSLPYLTDPRALVAQFEAITGATVKVNGVDQQSGVTANDFTGEVTYQTTAEDGVTARNYEVKVNIEQVDPNSVAWQRVTDNGGWGPYRTSMAGYHGGKFWAFGSASGGFGAFNFGAFSSGDAAAWATVTTNIDTLPYAERQTAVFGFKDKVWLLGGLVPAKGFNFSYVTNAVWSSANGTEWTSTPRIAAPAAGTLWTGRERINAVAFNDRLWVVGGNAYPAFGNANAPGTPLSDVWSTADGATWTQATDKAFEVARTNPAVFVHDGKIHVAGGRNASGTLLNDIWTSTDGVTWTELTVANKFTPTWGHQIISYNDQLFLIGGFVKNEANADVIQQGAWISEDGGANWTRADASDPRALPGNFPGRALFNAFVHDNAIWIVGGESRNESNAQVFLNDTWKGALVK